jgi:hypothetical protein
VEGGGRNLILGDILEFCWKDLGKLHETSEQSLSGQDPNGTPPKYYLEALPI